MKTGDVAGERRENIDKYKPIEGESERGYEVRTEYKNANVNGNEMTERVHKQQGKVNE